MSLENDIKQNRPFQNHKERALVNILFTYNWLADLLNVHFAQFGVTRKQYNILRILNGAQDPMTTSEIRERMLDKMSDITRLIDRLLRKDWVHKSIRKNDKRLVDIVISEKGQQLLKKIAHSQKPIHTYLSGLTDSEAETLNFLLDKARNAKQ